MTVSRSRLRLHEGHMFLQLAAKYPKLSLMIVEAVQNAIDANATRIFVGIDLDANRIVVCDNGDGVSIERFDQALDAIGESQKRAGSLGRFGIGLISPIDKCEDMWFCSRVKGTTKVNGWHFVGTDIGATRHDLEIPRQEWPKLPTLPEPFTHSHNDSRIHKSDPPISWNTIVILNDITRDSATGEINPDEIEGLIRTKLGHGMRRKGTHVTLVVAEPREIDPSVPAQNLEKRKSYRLTKRRIDPRAFTGEPLEVVEYEDQIAGKIILTFYRSRLSPAGKREGKVGVTEWDDEYPVTAAELYAQALQSPKYAKDVKAMPEIKLGFDALKSGYFEGRIQVQHIQLAPERDKFKLNGAIEQVYLYIGLWYETVGRAYMENEKEAQAEERYRDLGAKSLQRLIDELTHNPQLAQLARNLRGTLPGMRTSRPEPKQNPSPPKDRAPKDPKTRKVVVRPRQHAEASGKSPVTTFISYAYEMLMGSTRLWEYDVENGVLTFNIRHELWVMVDEIKGKQTARTDKQVMDLQEWLTLKVLLILAGDSLASTNALAFEQERTATDNELPYYIPWVILRK